MKTVEGRCPIHGTVVCPLNETTPTYESCKECQIAVKRIKAGKAVYVAERRLEEHLLDRALKGVRKSLRHAYAD